MNTKFSENEELESHIGAPTFLTVLLAIILGSLAATLLLPAWMPGLLGSLLGPDPKVFWYLSRGSACVALSLLWVSMALGLAMTNKLARTWPGVPAAFALHEYVSLLGLAFSIFHGLILLGDHYIQFDLVQVLVPFAAVSYKPVWVGLGQLGFYVWLIVALSFYVRSHIGQKTWRLLHYVSFLTYCMAFYHGITSGTDTSVPWANTYYWVSGGSLLFLLFYRVILHFASRWSGRQSIAAQHTHSVV